MPFRRKVKKPEILRRAVRATFESLERRTLCTSVVNGVFTGTNTQFDGRTIFEYRQGNGNAPIRISIFGNVTAEFIGAHAAVGQEQFQFPSGVVLSDLPDAINNPTLTVPTFLFSIYVVHADMNSAISIAQVPETNVTTGRPMQPFNGGTTIRFFNATTGSNAATVTTTDGGAFIGCLTANNLQAPNNSIPLIVADDPTTSLDNVAFGLRPANAGTLYAGLQTAPGVSLGKFFLGGTITGVVNVAGSMDTFYAGNILTGNAQGIGALESAATPPSPLDSVYTRTPAKNFRIGGSIRNIVSANSLGTITLLTNSGTDVSDVTYKTGFQLDVEGRVGQIFANNSFLGSAIVRDNVKVNEPGAAQHEIEVRGVAQTGNVSYFDPQFFGMSISLGDQANDARFFNDTFATAQFLGTSNSTTIKARDSINLLGTLADFGGVTGQVDAVDYYAVPLLAGQTMEIQLLDKFTGVRGVTAHPRLGIFDPDGRLIATDYSYLGQTARLGKAMRIVADRPGAYRVAVAFYGDINFNGLIDTATEPTVGALTDPYELRINRVGDIALGGLIANGNIATMDRDNSGIEVLRGDLGEVRSGAGAANLIFSLSLPWKVYSGSFRAMEAVNMGINAAGAGGGPSVFVPLSGPDFLVQRGSVGLLRTTGATATSVMMINDGVSSSTGDVMFPVDTDDLSLTAGALAVGRTIQLVDCAGALEGDLLSKGGIGVIRALSVGGLISNGGAGGGGGMSSPVWQVNVDGKGNDGIIDLIDVTGNINMPAIATGPGGNVRYVHVPTGAQVFRDRFFGTGFPEGTTYGQGQVVSLTDDSGASVTLTPTPRDPNTTFPLPTGASSFLDAPRLNVVTLPVRDKGGVIIVRVTVAPTDDTTDGVVRTGGGGLLVQSQSSGPNGSVEIGEIVRGAITGFTAAGAPAAQTFTFDPFNRVYTLTALAGAATDPRPVNFTFKGQSTIDVWNINDLFANDTITSVVNSTNGEIANIVSLGVAGALAANAPDIFNLEANTIGLAKTNSGTAVEGRIVLDNTLPYLNQRNLVRVADVPTLRARAGLGNILADNLGNVVANYGGSNDRNAFEGVNAPIVVRQPGGGTSQLTGNLVSLNIGEGIRPTGTGVVSRSGVFVDGLIGTIVGNNADIRGVVTAAAQTTLVAQQAVDPITGAALTNPDGTPLIVSTPTSIIAQISLTNGSIIDAPVMTVPVLQSSPTFLNGRTSLAAPGSTFDKPSFAIGSIKLKGDGGILGAFILSSNVGPINIDGGFGFLTSLLLTTGGTVVDGISTDGYGIRNSTISTASLNHIIARGNGKNVAVTNYNARARYSEGSGFDPHSGTQLDEFNDLYLTLGTTAAQPALKNVTVTGRLEDSLIVGSRDLGTVDVFQILAKDTVITDPATGKRVRTTAGNALYPMRISFGNSAGSITARDGIDGLTLNAGTLSKLSTPHNISRTVIRSSGSIGSIQAGILRDSSSIQVTGGDGKLNSLITRGDLFGQVIVSQDIGTIKVGGDLGASKVAAGRNLQSLTVNGSILTGSTVDVKGTLFNLTVVDDIKAGAVVKAHKINKQTIGGQVAGDIIIT